ncbi:MAG TPA: hypothetical protein VGK93_12875 [Candidatus Eisenbacteria bacterium]|jgi:hypothetical protein
MKPSTMIRVNLCTVAVLGLAACGQNANRLMSASPDLGGGAGITASSNLITLPFEPDNFVKDVDNRYFPLRPGTTYTYRGVSKDGVELNTVEVTHNTKTILGVPTIVVHDAVYIEDGSLSEDTFDWYAQDRQGNVWYFGEDTKTYDHGMLVTTEGSWEAGKNDAKAGIIMLADPHVGDTYQQEDSPGVVADMAKVVSLTETATVEAGTFRDCLETTEWTPIEPGNRSHKFYAPGVGTVLELSTRQGGERVELIGVK